SHIPIICLTCRYEWEPTISHHIRDMTGCPNCNGVLKWTLVLFLEAAPYVHGEGRYDYSKITPEHIKGKNSRVPVTCLWCGFYWEPTVNCHINQGSGCLVCTG